MGFLKDRIVFGEVLEFVVVFINCIFWFIKSLGGRKIVFLLDWFFRGYNFGMEK